MINQLSLRNISKILLIDTLAIGLIYLLPALSHAFPFPLYYMEPMRIIAIVVYFISNNKNNTYLIALTLPLFSMIFTGHPIPIKAALISIELFFNVLILNYLIENFNFRKIFLALIFSILASKIIYYSIKFFLLQLDFLSGSLISIPLAIQLISLTITSSIFYLFLKNKSIKLN
jgi:hypothetical protein